MGMTDKQFNGFLRFLYDCLDEAMKEQDPKVREEKIKKVMENIQKTIED